MAAEEYDALGFGVGGDGVARVTLDRPEADNALDLTMARELFEAALRCDEVPEVRTVVSRALGRTSASAATEGVRRAGGPAAPLPQGADRLPLRRRRA